MIRLLPQCNQLIVPGIRYLVLGTLYLVLSTLLSSCEPEITRVEVNLHSLSASEILQADCVYFFRQKVTADQKKLGADYYERAKKIIENDLQRGVYLLKRSLSLDPGFLKYAELGDAYIKNEQYSEAQDIFRFLCYKPYLQLGEKSYTDTFFLGMPDENAYYKMMLSEMLTNNQIWGETYWMAQDAGLDMKAIRDRLISDPDFPYTKGSSAYQNIMVQFMSDEEIEKYQSSPEGFKHFLESISDSSEVFEIKGNELAAFSYQSAEMNYDEMMPRQNAEHLHIFFLKEKQDDPSAWIKYDLKNRFRLNKDVHVVVYAIDSSATACPVDMRHIFHRLVTYDNRGKILDSKIVAWQDGVSAAELIVKRDMVIIYHKVRKWKNEYTKNDFDNELLSSEYDGESRLIINPDGEITGEIGLPIN